MPFPSDLWQESHTKPTQTSCWIPSDSGRDWQWPRTVTGCQWTNLQAAKSAHASPRAPQKELIWVYVLFAINRYGSSTVTGSRMFWGVERSHIIRQHQASWQLQDTQWKGCVLLSTCQAEPSAAREVGHEEHTNLSNPRESPFRRGSVDFCDSTWKSQAAFVSHASGQDTGHGAARETHQPKPQITI